MGVADGEEHGSAEGPLGQTLNPGKLALNSVTAHEHCKDLGELRIHASSKVETKAREKKWLQSITHRTESSGLYFETNVSAD